MLGFGGEVQMVGVGGNLLDEGFLGLVDEDDRRLEEPTHLVGGGMVRGQQKAEGEQIFEFLNFFVVNPK